MALAVMWAFTVLLGSLNFHFSLATSHRHQQTEENQVAWDGGEPTFESTSSFQILSVCLRLGICSLNMAEAYLGQNKPSFSHVQGALFIRRSPTLVAAVSGILKSSRCLVESTSEDNRNGKDH